MVIFTGIAPVARPLATRLKNARKLTSSSLRARHLLVVKFGGSSLANATRVADASRLVAKEYAKGTRLVIVVSAVGRTTDHLLRLTNGASGIIDTDRDDILAMGERTSARIFSASLKGRGVQVHYFDPSERDWPIVTDENFSNANPLVGPSIRRIRKYVEPLLGEGIVPVVGGFIGRTADGRVSTLGRGGSDTTALLLARALGAHEVVLVTNVPGIMTGDPKIVSDTLRLRRVSVEMLMGIADSGSKFIHRKALRYKDPTVNVRVISGSAGDLHAQGTIIDGGPLPELEVKLHNPHPVSSITLIGNSLATTPNLARNVIRIVRQILVGGSQDENSIILYVKQQTGFNAKLDRLHNLVRDKGASAIAVRTGLAMLSVRGVGLEETPGVIARISEALRSEKVNIFGLITIASSIIVFTDWKVRKNATRLVRRSLLESS